jgi:hypothetical protein
MTEGSGLLNEDNKAKEPSGKGVWAENYLRENYRELTTMREAQPAAITHAKTWPSNIVLSCNLLL